jgi:flagellar motor switch protein FliN/FliY
MDESNGLKQENKKGTVKGDEVKERDKSNLDLILDIPLDVSVELGRIKMAVNDLLQLGQGAVIELDKPVGEPAEIYVNRKLVAKGEIVVVDEKLCIRVTDSISPVERVKSLG